MKIVKMNKKWILVQCVVRRAWLTKVAWYFHDKCSDSNLRPLVMVSMSSLASSSTLLASSNTISICDDLEDLEDENEEIIEIETPKEDSPEPGTGRSKLINIYCFADDNLDLDSYVLVDLNWKVSTLL